MKIHPRLAPVLFAGLLSTIMVSLITALLLARREGVHTAFVAHGWQGFWSTWPVAFPTALVVAPWVRRFVASVTEQEAH